MAEAMEEDSTSSAFTPPLREHLTYPIEPMEDTSVSSNRRNLQAAGLSDSPPLFQEESNVTKSGQTKIDKCYIERNDGTIIVNVPEKTTPNVVCIPTGFYTTPEEVDKVARSENRCFSTVNRSTRCKNNGAKPVQRALQYGANVINGHGGAIRKSGTETSVSQSKLPFPCRKRAASVAHTSRKKATSNGEQLKRVEINVGENNGNIFVGDNKIFVNENGREHTKHISPQKRLTVRNDRAILKHLDRFYQITNKIYPLRDNGRWTEFYDVVDKGISIARKNGQLEEEIFMTIEKSTAFSYQKENEQSMEMVKRANEMIKRAHGLEIKEFLTVMSHCQLAALYRRENKMFQADQAVVIAEQNAEFVPTFLAKAYVFYEKASIQALLLSIVSTQEPEREYYEKNAKEDLKTCISLCEQILDEDDAIYLRKHLFSILKLALMNLNCRTPNGRSQPVRQDSIREANDCITRMQDSYSGQMSKASTILLLKAQCDHKYRTGDYPNAIIYGSQALEIAEMLGFHIEITELQERLRLLELPQRLRLASLCNRSI